MSRMKRILAFTICLLLAVTSLPVTQIVLANDGNDENNGTVVFHENGYTADDEIKWDTINDPEWFNTYVDTDGGYKVEQLKENINVKKTPGLRRSFGDFVIEKDEDNRTQVVADGINGKFRMDLDFEALMKKHSKATGNPNIGISFVGSDNKTIYYVRIHPSALEVADNESIGSAQYKRRSEGLSYDKSACRKVLSIELDTATGEIDTYLDEELMTTYKEEPDLSTTIASGLCNKSISKLKLSSHKFLDIGSYIKFHDIKFTQYENGASTILSALPEKLVNDVNNVTESSVELEAIDGVDVKWSSSDESVAKVNGNTLTFLPSRTETKEAVVLAKFTHNGANYTKTYKMTLAQKPYKVNFYDKDGELYSTLEVNEGNCSSKIEAPTEDNLTFLGWYEEDANNEFDFTKPIIGDVNLYPKYEGAPSKVVFIADGNTINTLNGKFGGFVEGEIPEIPNKPGYTAVGWYIGDTDEMFTASTPIDNINMTVKAKYIEGELNSYTVNFMVDGELYKTESVFHGYPVEMPKNPIKDNYTFAYWMLNGEEYNVENPVTSNIDLEAKFNPSLVSVKFYMDKEMTELYQEGTCYYNTTYGALPVPTKDLHKFLGWKFADGTEFTAETVVTEPVLVYADWEYRVKVLLEEYITNYTSNSGNAVHFENVTSPFFESYFDDGFVVKFIDSKPKNRDFNDALIATLRIPETEYDEGNRTQLYNFRLIGDYEIEIIFDAKLSSGYTAEDGTSVSTPYGRVSTGTYTTSFNPIMYSRINNSKIQSFNSESIGTNTLNDLAADKKGSYTTFEYTNYKDGIAKDVSLRIRYDSFEDMVRMSMDKYNNVAWGPGVKKLDYINAFHFRLMGCNRVGDYIKIKKVKVTRYNDYSDSPEFAELQSIFSELPTSIVNDPYDAKGTINLPDIKGVKWSSSDENVVSTATGEIKPWYSDSEVEIVATITSGKFHYEKVYTLTVKGEAADPEEIINETFTDEEDVSDWTFVSLEDKAIADYFIDENGIKFSKVSPALDPDKGYETKRFFAFYDLYTEEKSDAYTTTSSKDVKGVYDVTLNVGEYLSTSEIPINIGVGYRNGTAFYPYGSVVFDTNGVRFTYNQDTIRVKEYNLGDLENDSTLKIRIDNIKGEIALFKDGSLLMIDKCDIGFGENSMINTVRVALDVNNEIGDFVTLKGIKVDKIIKNDIPELSSVMDAADSLTINTVTNNPDSVSGINSLPTTVGNCKVEWKSSSNQIDVETGEIFFAPTPTPVTITAEIYDEASATPVVVKKEFNVTVRKAETDTELGQFKIAQLGKITNQQYSDIRYDLNLPEADGVEWKSSKKDVIGNDGKINDTVVLTDATPVTITATSNDVSKSYNLVVSPRTEQVELSKGTLPLSITLKNKADARVSSDVTAKFTYKHSADNTGKVNILNDNGEVLASMVATETGIYFDYNGSDYKEITLTYGQSVNVEFIVMPDLDKLAVFVDNALVVDYADLKIETEYVASVNTSNPAIEVGNVVLTVDKYGMLNANLDNFDYFAGVSTGYATKSGIILPKNIVSSGTVTWTSSNPSLIDGNGKVTEPEVITYADIEFKITDNSDSRIFINKVFKVAVDCNSDKNIVYSVVPEITNLKSSKYPARNATDNDISTAMKLTDSFEEDSEIVFDLGVEKTFNSVLVALAENISEDFEVYSSVDGQLWKKIGTYSFDAELTKFVEFNPVVAKQIKIVVKKTDVTDVYINEIKVYLSATKDELAQIDLDSIVIPATAEGSKITLPETGVNGTAITWASSDGSVIDKDGNVTRPSSAITVTLTATVMVNGNPVSKEFEVYVDTKSNTGGPSQVGGGSGGGGGATAGAITKPVIGETANDTIYAEDVESDEPSVDNALYSDVKSTDWYFDAVTTLTEKGVISGDGTGKFNPSDKVTREQFIKMILESLDIEVVDGENKFTDVDENAWYVDYIITASELGIVNGLAQTHFGIGTSISRQDMAVLIERVLTYKKVEIEKVEHEPFADAHIVSEYAKDAVANMKAIGLIKGYNNNYNPKDNLTRAEAATVIATLLELLAK